MLATPQEQADRRAEQDEFAALCAAVTVPVEELQARPSRMAALGPLVRTQDDRSRPLAIAPDGALLLADPWRFTQAALVHAASLVRYRDAAVDELRRVGMDVLRQAAADMDWAVVEEGDSHVLARADVDCPVLLELEVLRLLAPELEHIDGTAQFAERCAEIALKATRLGAQHSLLAVVGDGRSLLLDTDVIPIQGTKGAPWLTGLHDLRLIGEALRRDPLALPTILEQTTPPPWPEGLDLVDMVGIGRRLEEPPQHQDELPADGTEHMHLRARYMAMRHPAPHPDGDGWIEVTRWPGSPDSALFHTPEAGRFAVLARAPGRSIWFACSDERADRHDLAGTIVAMAAYWAARLLEDGFLEELLSEMNDVATRVDVELSELPGPALILSASDDPWLRLVVGPAFIHELCRGDNRADRMLIGALIALSPLAVGDPDGLMDRVAPEGRGTFTIWPAPDLRNNEPRLEPPPLVTRERVAVERHLAAHFVPNDKIVVLPAGEAKAAIDDMQARLEVMICERTAELAPTALPEMIALYERALLQSGNEAIGLPARAAFSDPDERFGPRESSAVRGPALRALVERLAASVPTGDAPLSMRRAGWLRAAAELQIELGAASDALYKDPTGGRVVVSPLVGVIPLFDGPLPTAGRRAYDHVERIAPDVMALEHSDWWTDEPTAPPIVDVAEPIEFNDPKWRAVDSALRDEWGVGLDELVRLLRALHELADEQPTAMATREPNTLLEQLPRSTGVDLSTVRCALQHLTLGRCDPFAAVVPEHQPWRSNRERSYLRRPLVLMQDGQLCWSASHVLDTARHLNTLIESNRLRGGSALRRAVGQVSQALDRGFEGAVADRTDELGWTTRRRVTEIGGVPLQRAPGQPIGDIDALAWSPSLRQVWLLDAKRLSTGYEAAAVTRQASRLEHYATHHLERLAWVEAHSEELRREIGDPPRGRWRVRAALVLDRPLASAHLRDFGQPVFTYWDLKERLASRR